jgi:2-oxoglutarate ferredoxin oxidoreductase subunit alpha
MQTVRTEYPDWAVRGSAGREKRILSSIYIDPVDEEVMNFRLMKVWNRIQENEIRYKEYFLEDAELVVIGYGTAGRVALSAVRAARAEGIRAGLFRPISLSPFPQARIEEIAGHSKAILVTEMNSGQMLDDVLRATKGRLPVEFYARLGGMVPFPDEILAEIRRMSKGSLVITDDPRRGWMERFASVLQATGSKN